MTTHLSAQEFVNALDGALAAARQSHLEGCASCQTQVDQLRAVMAKTGDDAQIPEPSPLFWDHFQARVLTAVQAESQPARRAWWTNWADVRTLIAGSAVVIALVASVTLYVNRQVTPVPATLADGGEVVESGVLADASAALESDEWEFVSSVMGGLEGDDIHEVLTPSHDAVDAAFEALTVAERDRFMKLLKAELGEGLE